MDDPTAQYYASRVKELAARYNACRAGGVSRHFSLAFPAGGRVLDIGAGSGRDMALLAGLGCDVYGVDVSAAMVSAAIESFPFLENRYAVASLPSEGVFFGGGFDGILCSAVLMHVPDEQCFDAAFTIRGNLREKGRLLLSVPLERQGVDENGRLPDGRLFILRPVGYYLLLFERLGFRLIFRHEDNDGLGRKDIRWAVMVMELESSRGARSIDRIEGILNRDRKTATYKLALFRALADIAASEYNCARWCGDNLVGVPLMLIAEKWLVYYWGLFESGGFIPQINGEKPGCRMPVKFRSALGRLIEENRPLGGLNFVYRELKTAEGAYAPGALAEALGEIADTIVKGPVTFAGGSLDGGRVFSYDPPSKRVLMPADIWKELCLMHHWIRDALILRWGELTERMSKGEVPASRVIELLLKLPVAERDTLASRDIFTGVKDLRCVWTGKSISAGRFDIDHVIPWSLWYNNDLWNLLPADPKVNNRKRDKLPASRLWRGRSEAVIDYWRAAFSSMPRRFLGEVKLITGRDTGRDWEKPLHAAITEAIEVTALQRGIERWEGE